jgi:hypothetical protein
MLQSGVFKKNDGPNTHNILTLEEKNMIKNRQSTKNKLIKENFQSPTLQQNKARPHTANCTAFFF